MTGGLSRSTDIVETTPHNRNSETITAGVKLGPTRFSSVSVLAVLAKHLCKCFVFCFFLLFLFQLAMMKIDDI